jgi:predicted ATPase
MIDRLSLKNFKSIEDDFFDLGNLNVFSGLNGAGKSSIFQSLLLLRQSYEKHLLPDTGISLVGEYSRIGTGKDLLYVGAEDEIIGVHIEWNDHELDLKFEYTLDSDMQKVKTDVSRISGLPFETALFTSQFQYLSADRISPKTTYEVSDYAVNQNRSLGIKGEYTAHFIAVNGSKNISIAALAHPDAATASIIDNLNAWMSEITPGTRVIAKLIPEINQASLHYQFASASEMTEPFRPENVGFGLTYVLPVVLAVLAARAGDILMIENPESHLHPGGQSLMGKMMSIAAQNGVQIFIETHSDHFFNGVRNAVKSNYIQPDNIKTVFLTRDPDSDQHNAIVHPVSINANGRVEYWPPGFFDEWEKSLDSLLEE